MRKRLANVSRAFLVALVISHSLEIFQKDECVLHNVKEEVLHSNKKWAADIVHRGEADGG
jgi:hypothetical protein